MSISSIRGEWGVGQSPTTWNTTGVSVLWQSGQINNAPIVRWDTGSVEAGVYTFKITTEFGGGLSYSVSRTLAVNHGTFTVSSVGGDFSSVQSAINGCQSGDTIVVADIGAPPFTVDRGV